MQLRAIMQSRLKACGLLLATAVLSAILTAQSPPAPNSPALEVASIRLNTSSGPVASIGVSPSGLLTFTNVTMRDLIQRTYRLPMAQIVGRAGVAGHGALRRASAPLEVLVVVRVERPTQN